MKRFKLFILSIVSAFSICACSLYTIDSETMTSEFYPSKNSRNEVVYLENVNRPYEMIGRVEVNAERTKTKEIQDIIDKLKYEAAILGGDAITNITTNAGNGKWAKNKPKKLFGNANIRTNFVADVIVFKETSHSNPQGGLKGISDKP